MANEKISLFVDTNAFIQLKDLKDIPWRKLFPKVKDLEILVSSAVIEELDDFKVGKNKRKRDRARLALKQIVHASTQDNNEVLLREEPFTISLKLAPHKPISWDDYPSLDKTKNDHRLIADAINYNDGSILFSFDTAPIVTARMLSLRAEQPKEEWLLPAELTETELKLKLVQNQLALARVNDPKIEVGYGSIDAPVNKIDLIVPILPVLDTDLIQRLVESYLSIYPRQTITVKQRSNLMVGSIYSNEYTQADKDEYYSKYASFESEVENYFQNLHLLVRKVALAQPVPYFLRNNSPAMAENLKAEFKVSENFYFLSDRNDADDSVGKAGLPEAPDKPLTGINRFSPSHLHGLIEAKKDKDPTGFYWQQFPKYGSQDCSKICKEFRATEVYENESWICLADKENNKGELEIKITASNLRQPLNLVSQFELKECDVSWLDERVLRRLPIELAEILKTQIKSN